MCSYHIHECKVCHKNYPCEEPDWVCPTLNFDENALMCPVCELNYFHEMQQFAKDDDKGK